jgi:hypothetical protein
LRRGQHAPDIQARIRCQNQIGCGWSVGILA